ncbi:MAG: GYD domain-containing protein [Nevskiaceae bacterium]|nr:MAG: GYD domain-containing protein [Nevskiaceae bacterium]
MPTFITLANWTDQGIRNVKDSPQRHEAFKAMAAELGVEIKSFYYTVGQYDLVLISEGTDEAVMAMLLRAGLSNTRSQTMRGFSLQEMKKILGKM